tara:strand:- start:2437 stop:3243 length:807 start_codon:yes stop_codon:yes gene_type:complete
MATLKLTMTNAFDRTILNEGRNFGVGFAYVTPVSEESITAFKTMQAFTACKDYLNDLVYVERHAKPLGKVHGFEHIYTGEFKDKDFVYLGFKPVHYKPSGGSSMDWTGFEKTTKSMKKNIGNLVTSINKLENLLDLSTDRTTFYGSTETEYVLSLPKIWVQRGWLTSLMTLWIRCFFNITATNAKASLTKLIETHENKITIPADKYLFAVIKKFVTRTDFKELLKDERPKLGDQPGTVHNLGISNFCKGLIKETIKPNEKKIASTVVS